MKILIIRFSSIGDIVLTTPVIRCLYNGVNKVEIHYLTKEKFEPLLIENPYIHKIHKINKKTDEVIAVLKSENFDYIMDLHNNFRSLQVKKKLNVEAFSFRKLNFQKWFYVTTKINIMPSIHIVDRYMETLQKFNIKNDFKGLDFYIPERDKINIKRLPKFLHTSFIGFVIGGSYEGKVLPEFKIIEICNALSDKSIILLGGPEDEKKAKSICKHSKNKTIYNACGKYNIMQSSSIISQANCIISHDTGLMHIASAFKKKIISIWGATVPEFGMYPYLPGKGSVIIEPKLCYNRPYSKLGNKQFYKSKFKNMEKISIPDIIKAVNFNL